MLLPRAHQYLLLDKLISREGWFAIIPREGQPGETLCGLQVHLNDKSLAEFPNRDWPAIEHWAERGLLKPDVWKARRTNLSLIVKLEIPISGTAIQIQQQALQLDQVPDSWPCNLESGWAAHYGRLEMPFEALCQHLVQNQFTSDAFQGDSESHQFQGNTNTVGRRFTYQALRFFFLRLPIGQYGPVSQLSRSEERCTGPFNWGEAHCAGEKVKRKIGPFLRKSLKNQTRTRTQQKGAQPATATRNPLARLPGARAKEEKTTTNKRLHQQILVRLNVLDLQ